MVIVMQKRGESCFAPNSRIPLWGFMSGDLHIFTIPSNNTDDIGTLLA